MKITTFEEIKDFLEKIKVFLPSNVAIEISMTERENLKFMEDLESFYDVEPSLSTATQWSLVDLPEYFCFTKLDTIAGEVKLVKG